jgi:glyoxylase-like metal-dependent hydrolase (beta-lactamase superfamily II)
MRRRIIGEDVMLELTRRSILSGAAAAALMPVAAFTPARAVAPSAGKQAPSFYRYKLGTNEITVIHDGARTFPMPDIFVKNVSKDEALAAAESAYMPKGMVTVPFNPTVINTGSKLVLIDSGYGPNVAPTVGLLPVNMAAAGIDPKQIDIVILSHLHPDHINGIRAADGSAAFPQAEIKVPALDWAFWADEGNMSRAQGFMADYFKNFHRVFDPIKDKATKYEWGQEVAPGVTALDTRGHTPGHTSFAVASGSSKVLIQSDVTNIPELFLRHPDWQVMFDIDPQQAAATRHKFYDMAAAEKATIIGFHFPFPSIGHVEKDGNNYRLVPVAWNGTL